MGLLDMMNDPKQMGLMMAAANMMGQSGPSPVPVSLGQILGGGMGAYMNTKNAMTQQQADEEERKQMAEARKLEMQKAQMSLQESMRFNDFYKNRGTQGQRGAQMPAAQMGGGVFTSAATRVGLPADNDTLNQIVAGVNQGMTPEQAASQVAGGGQGQVSPRPSEYESLMQEANELRAAGFPKQASDAYELAIKLRTKFDTTPRIANGPDGKPFTYVLDEMGNPKRLDGFMPREEKKMLNLNNKFKAVNPFEVHDGTSFEIGRSADNVASVGAQIRGQNLNYAQNQAELEMGGKPPPGYRWTPNGTLSAIPGGPGDKLPEAQQKQVVGVNNLSNAINEYRSELKGFGSIDFAKPDARAVMGTKYNNMMLQAKEAYNLGVLNGPDMEILQSVITDPRSARGVFTSKAALDKQASELDRIMRKVAQVSGTARQPQQGNVVDFGSLK